MNSDLKLSPGRDAMQAALVAAILACVLGTSGCSGELQGPADSVTGSTATSLELDPSSVNLAPDVRVQFSAAILDQVGEPVAGQVDWTATGGAITTSGLYTAGQTPGSYSVTATEATTGVSGSAGVTIRNPGGGGGATISGVTWACNNLITDAPGSDLWPITWSDDGHQYTAWGDGNGFQGTTKAVYGIARIEGPPTNYIATDLAEKPGAAGDKIASLVSVGGVLYLIYWESSLSEVQLRKSTDKGQSVGGPLMTFDELGGGDVGMKFVQHGQDNVRGDGFVYATVATPSSAADPVYLVRVPEGQIEAKSAWEWFAGTPTNPTWGAAAQRQAIYSDPAANAAYSADEVIVTYFPQLDQYILTAHPGQDMGEWSMEVSPNVYGPWTSIAAYSDWCSVPEQGVDVLPRFIAPKWIEPIAGSSLRFSMIWSGTGQWDRFNLIEGTFELR